MFLLNNSDIINKFNSQCGTVTWFEDDNRVKFDYFVSIDLGVFTL